MNAHSSEEVELSHLRWNDTNRDAVHAQVQRVILYESMTGVDGSTCTPIFEFDVHFGQSYTHLPSFVSASPALETPSR